MSSLIVQILWLTAPVILIGIFHMVIVAKNTLASLAIPLDGGSSFRGVRVFGDNKTWRGVVVMILGSSVVGGLQGYTLGSWAFEHGLESLNFSLIGRDASWGLDASPTLRLALGYATVNIILGLGYVLGELPNSFVKRRLGIVAGKTGHGFFGWLFFLIDQADSIIAGLLLAVLLFGLSIRLFIIGTLVLTTVHLALNILLFLIRIRKNV